MLPLPKLAQMRSAAMSAIPPLSGDKRALIMRHSKAALRDY
jgi:hypothetical protein